MLNIDVQQIFQMAVRHHQAGRRDHAETLYRQLLAQNPNDANTLQLMGTLAMEGGRAEEAVDLIGRALKAYPHIAEFHSNMGLALRDLGRFDDAIKEFQTAMSLKPTLAEVHSNLGTAYLGLGRFEEALAACQKTLAMKPDSADAYMNLAVILLLQDRWIEAWPHFEWRWARQLIRFKPNFAQPEWDGKQLNGRTLYIRSEQGYGDSIQCIRYAQIAKQKGGRVIVAVPKGILALLQNVPGTDAVIEDTQTPPPFDCYCSMLSLPRVMGTTPDTIPGGVPYIHADKSASAKWAQRMSAHPGRRVGLVWAGKPSHINDRNRSLPLAALAPLAQIPNTTFYSLQKDAAGVQAKTPPQGMQIIDWTAELNDFTDTAALIDNLDVLVTVDTAVAHLAGAMGKKVFMLLPFIPDWRWLLTREDTPWYPTVRLFRQTKPRDWSNVIDRVAEALKNETK